MKLPLALLVASSPATTSCNSDGLISTLKYTKTTMFRKKLSMSVSQAFNCNPRQAMLNSVIYGKSLVTYFS